VTPDSGDDVGRALDGCAHDKNDLRRQIERKHGCVAHAADSVVVWELLGGRIAQERTVHVFTLEGHPVASRAYAWHDGALACVALHAGAVCGPAEAVAAQLRTGYSGAGGARD
jgi:hypothetical protein